MSRMQSGYGGGSRGASRGFGGGGGFGGDRDRYGGGGYGGGGARGKSMAGDNLRKVKWDNYTLVSNILLYSKNCLMLSQFNAMQPLNKITFLTTIYY